MKNALNSLFSATFCLIWRLRLQISAPNLSIWLKISMAKILFSIPVIKINLEGRNGARSKHKRRDKRYKDAAPSSNWNLLQSGTHVHTVETRNNEIVQQWNIFLSLVNTHRINACRISQQQIFVNWNPATTSTDHMFPHTLYGLNMVSTLQNALKSICFTPGQWGRLLRQGGSYGQVTNTYACLHCTFQIRSILTWRDLGTRVIGNATSCWCQLSRFSYYSPWFDAFFPFVFFFFVYTCVHLSNKFQLVDGTASLHLAPHHVFALSTITNDLVQLAKITTFLKVVLFHATNTGSCYMY